MTDTHDLVSCLCVTHNRVAMLRRALACFDAQTWPHRELVLLHEAGDTATRDFLAQQAHPLVRAIVVPTLPRMTMGAKRQALVEAARGRWIATWDDDDWSAPTRLADEIAVLRASGRAACALERWLVYDERMQEVWLSQSRPWEASLLAERAAMPRYEDVDRAEDFKSMQALVERQAVVTLRSPHLYVYVYHGGNIGSRAHFKRNVFAHSTKLPPAFAQRVAGLLARPQGAAITGQELSQALAAATRAPATP